MKEGVKGVNSFSSDCPHCPVFQSVKENRGFFGEMRASDNWIHEIAYGFGNSIYTTAQVVDFDILGQDYTNPISGGRAFINLDGTEEYNPSKVVLDVASFTPIGRGLKYGGSFLSKIPNILINSI